MECEMPESQRFQNATQMLKQIIAWQEEQDAKEEKQKSLILEKVRKEREIKQVNFNNSKFDEADYL
jgi:hypothetical protein